MTDESERAAEQGAAGYKVSEERCLRCAACSSVAPGVFSMGEAAAKVLRDPEGAAERVRCEVARLQCPGHAISREGRAPRVTGGGGETGIASTGIEGPGALFPRLFEEAERVRWRLVDLPWGSIEKDKVTPAFVRFVHEMALSELTTFSATKRFMSEMADDVDFSSWVAVWFYEETKHPDALFRWLSAFGVAADPKALLRGRVTAPFMRSRTGTLAMNVLSELFASSGYQFVGRYCKEPVLGQIFRNLAGDEARHGAAFYAFTERAIATSKAPDLERLAALKVLYYWVRAADHVEHPVNQFHEKVSADPELSSLRAEIGTDYGPVLGRACRVIGALIGKPLDRVEDVLPALREMSAALGQRMEG